MAKKKKEKRHNRHWQRRITNVSHRPAPNAAGERWNGTSPVTQIQTHASLCPICPNTIHKWATQQLYDRIDLTIAASHPTTTSHINMLRMEDQPAIPFGYSLCVDRSAVKQISVESISCLDNFYFVREPRKSRTKNLIMGARSLLTVSAMDRRVQRMCVLINAHRCCCTFYGEFSEQWTWSVNYMIYTL